MLVPATAILALGGRPGDVHQAAPQHGCVQNMLAVDCNVLMCLSLELEYYQAEKTF